MQKVMVFSVLYRCDALIIHLSPIVFRFWAPWSWMKRLLFFGCKISLYGLVSSLRRECEIESFPLGISLYLVSQK